MITNSNNPEGAQNAVENQDSTLVNRCRVSIADYISSERIKEDKEVYSFRDEALAVKAVVSQLVPLCEAIRKMSVNIQDATTSAESKLSLLKRIQEKDPNAKREKEILETEVAVLTNTMSAFNTVESSVGKVLTHLERASKIMMTSAQLAAMHSNTLSEEYLHRAIGVALETIRSHLESYLVQDRGLDDRTAFTESSRLVGHIDMAINDKLNNTLEGRVTPTAVTESELKEMLNSVGD
jgi:hypothetical protein